MKTLRTIALSQPTRLVVGSGCLKDCVEYIATHKPGHLHIVTSPSLNSVAVRMQQKLAVLGLRSTIDSGVHSEPTISDFEVALTTARQARATCVLGIGGGSVLDIAKLVAAFVHSGQQLHDAFGIGLLQPRTCHLICMPTTSGTGSEVSPNAILLDEKARLKKAVISPHLVPDATFVDPELSLTVPPHVTAATGLDALAHCIEAFTNKFAHPMVDLYALGGIALCGEYLLRAVLSPNDLEAREGMSLASLYGGLCLGPVNTAAGHALAYPLGSEYHLAHGVSVALVQPHVFRFNSVASPDRHAMVACALGVPSSCDSMATAEAGAAAISKLTQDCGVDPQLTSYGVSRDAIQELAASAMKVQRLLQNNPRDVTHADCVDLFARCFDSQRQSEA